MAYLSLRVSTGVDLSSVSIYAAAMHKVAYNAVHVEVEIVKLHLVGVRPGDVDRHGDLIAFVIRYLHFVFFDHR